MTYIEPAGLAAQWPNDSAGENTSFDATHRNKSDALRQIGFDKISNSEISKDVYEKIEISYSAGLSFDSELRDELLPFEPSPLDPYGPSIHTMYYQEGCAVFPDETAKNNFIFIGETRNKTHEVIQEFETALNDLGPGNPFGGPLSGFKTTKEDKIEFSLVFGENYADYLTEQICDPVNIEEEFDNRFEEKIHEDLVENLTSCITTNADLYVGAETDENREYDFLLHVTPTDCIYIEAKRTLQTKGMEVDKNWKRDLIGKPFEYKVLLDQQAGTFRPNPVDDLEFGRTECFVIVDELDRGRFGDFPKMATDRDIGLIERDKNKDYIKKVREVCRKMVYDFTKPMPRENLRDKRMNL